MVAMVLLLARSIKQKMRQGLLRQAMARFSRYIVWSMSFDLRTAMVLTGGMSIFMVLVLFSAFRAYSRQVRGLRAWTWGTFLSSIASALFILRDFGPGWLVAGAANAALFSALALQLWGTRRLFGLTFAARRWFAAVAVIWLVQLWYAEITPDFFARTVAATSLIFVFYGVQLASMLRYGVFRPPQIFFGLSMVAGMLLMAFRDLTALQTLAFGAPALAWGFWTPSTVQTTYLLGFALISLLHPIAFLLLANDQMHAHLQTLSNLDPLTQALNRRALAQVAAQELERNQRHQQPLSVLAMDLDHFKHVNDQFGHDMGDKVLVHFADVVQGEIRKTDHFARMGGEEFIVLLPHTESAEALQMARRIQKALLNTAPAGLPSCTCSMGLVQLAMEDKTLDSVLKRADQALYLAKENGRNRIEVV